MYELLHRTIDIWLEHFDKSRERYHANVHYINDKLKIDCTMHLFIVCCSVNLTQVLLQ